MDTQCQMSVMTRSKKWQRYGMVSSFEGKKGVWLTLNYEAMCNLYNDSFALLLLKYMIFVA